MRSKLTSRSVRSKRGRPLSHADASLFWAGSVCLLDGAGALPAPRRGRLVTAVADALRACSLGVLSAFDWRRAPFPFAKTAQKHRKTRLRPKSRRRFVTTAVYHFCGPQGFEIQVISRGLEAVRLRVGASDEPAVSRWAFARSPSLCLPIQTFCWFDGLVNFCAKATLASRRSPLTEYLCGCAQWGPFSSRECTKKQRPQL